jgi:hypothetical protein
MLLAALRSHSFANHRVGIKIVKHVVLVVCIFKDVLYQRCPSNADRMLVGVFVSGVPYYIHTSPATWSYAQTICRSHGMDLATIYSSAQNTELVAQVLAAWPNSTAFWVGASDAAVEGNWTWSDGSPWTFAGFSSGLPNGGAAQNCAAIRANGWDDQACNLATPFVCGPPGVNLQGSHWIPNWNKACCNPIAIEATGVLA